jgi:hypothetical protein
MKIDEAETREKKEKITVKEREIAELNSKINMLNSEIEMHKKINENMDQELKLSSENLLCINKEMEEFKLEKINEIRGLNDSLMELNTAVTSLKKENQLLKFEIDSLSQEKIKWEALDLYHQLLSAEKRLEESENQRSWLQEQLANISGEFEKKMEIMMKENAKVVDLKKFLYI